MTKDIIDVIRDKMANDEISIRRLASETGVSYPYLQGVLSRAHSPTLEFLHKIMSHIGLELRAVLK